jgi:hypothetical protein
MTHQSRDTPIPETELARELIGQARENWLAKKPEKAVELARGIVDRYWGVDGTRATRLVADAYSVYLHAVMDRVKTVEQVRLVLEQYDILIARCLKAGEIKAALNSLRSKKLTSLLWKDYSAGYAAATGAVLLVQEHRDALTEETGEPITQSAIIENLREELEDRCAISDKPLFVGAVEDLVGFELEHRQDDSFYTCRNATDWLFEQGLQGLAVSLIMVILDRFPERKDEICECFFGNISRNYFEDIDKYWLEGQSQIFSWRLPKVKYEDCVKLLGRLSQNASSEEEEILRELTYSAVRAAFR